MNPEVTGAIAVAKDVATGLAAVVAATVAILGLKAWRRQLRGQTRYELARRLLRAVYRARDELYEVRNPLILPGELSAARQEAALERDDKAATYTAEDEAAVYERRWKRLGSAMSDLQVEVTEGEVIFGKAIVDHVQPFRECVKQLFFSLRRFLQRKMRPSHREDSAEIERVEAVVYRVSDDPDKDPFTAKVAQAVAHVEEFVRPHLKL